MWKDESGRTCTTFGEIVDADERERGRRRKGLECGHPVECLDGHGECGWCAAALRRRLSVAKIRALLDEVREELREPKDI